MLKAIRAIAFKYLREMYYAAKNHEEVDFEYVADRFMDDLWRTSCARNDFRD